MNCGKEGRSKMDYIEMSKKKREAEAKSDLIGMFYKSELFDLLGLDKEWTHGERSAWRAFVEALGEVAGDEPVMKKNNVEDRAQDFGNEREEAGFRSGFHVAMRLCMEGLNGGIG